MRDARSEYRLQFPRAERPRLSVGDAVYEVVDCAPGGIRYLQRSARLPAPGEPDEGVIAFARGETVEVAGTVVRAEAGEVAVKLSHRRIPFAALLAEQRWLLKHYPVV